MVTELESCRCSVRCLLLCLLYKKDGISKPSARLLCEGKSHCANLGMGRAREIDVALHGWVAMDFLLWYGLSIVVEDNGLIPPLSMISHYKVQKCGPDNMDLNLYFVICWVQVKQLFFTSHMSFTSSTGLGVRFVFFLKYSPVSFHVVLSFSRTSDGLWTWIFMWFYSWRE